MYSATFLPLLVTSASANEASPSRYAYTVANVIARSVEYARCFVTATDQFGNELFSVGLTSAATNNQPYPPPPLASRATAREIPERDSYVVDAEIIPIAPRLPPRRY